MTADNNPHTGFTLIELSIVLVIIALLIGGVLVGKDMIKAAKIRQQVSQIEQLDTAANAFKAKYNCLPGDCPNATALGFTAISANWGMTNPNGDGNGIVTCSNVAGSACGSSAPDQLGENYYFWAHLYQANLIPSLECTNTANCVSGGGGLLGVLTPRPKLEYQGTPFGNLISGGIGIAWAGNYNPGTVAAMRIQATNFYQFSGYIPAGYAHYKPSDISAVDMKMDDGLPATGKVLSYYIGSSGSSFANEHGGWTPNTCTDNSDRPNDGIPPTKYMPSDNFECLGFIVKVGF